MPEVHAKLSPSSGERWINCTGSFDLIDRLNVPEPVGSFAAQEGTLAHSVLENDMLLMLGAAEVGGVVAEQGSIEANCDFCHAKYVFDETDVNALFGADIVDTARQEIRRLQ